MLSGRSASAWRAHGRLSNSQCANTSTRFAKSKRVREMLFLGGLPVCAKCSTRSRRSTMRSAKKSSTKSVARSQLGSQFSGRASRLRRSCKLTRTRTNLDSCSGRLRRSSFKTKSSRATWLLWSRYVPRFQNRSEMPRRSAA